MFRQLHTKVTRISRPSLLLRGKRNERIRVLDKKRPMSSSISSSGSENHAAKDVSSEGVNKSGEYGVPNNIVFNPLPPPPELANNPKEIYDQGDVYTHLGGTERAEIIDPHYWDELLPGIVDVEGGVGSSFLNPVVVPTFGDTERIVGCMGDCWKVEGIDYDNVEFQYWVMEEDSFGVCGDCGLHFFCASNESIQQIGYPVQGNMNAEAQKKLLSAREEPVPTAEDYELSHKYLTEKYERTKTVLNSILADSSAPVVGGADGGKSDTENGKALTSVDHFDLDEEEEIEEQKETVEEIKLEMADIMNAKEFLNKLQRGETTIMKEHFKDLDESEERRNKAFAEAYSKYVIEPPKEEH